MGCQGPPASEGQGKQGKDALENPITVPVDPAAC